MVRIEVNFQYKGVSYSKEDTSFPIVNYDVLLQNINTATPRVVAWNVPSNPNELKPYMNSYTQNQSNFQDDVQEQNEDNE